jgi:large subunit ribosomal protein L13
VESELDDVYYSEDMGIDNIDTRGKFVQPYMFTDYEYMMTHMLPIPDKETRLGQYILEKEGVVYHVFNAERVPFGRMCTQIANAIRGKNKPIFKRIDPGKGDKVVVVNAEKALFMGRKLKFKNLKYHTGTPGGLKTKKFKDLLFSKPELMIFNSVYKMLPKNRTRFIFLENLKIYAGGLQNY